jgi:beta-galactosidase
VAASWTWTSDVAAGSPLHVEAYAAADEVEFRLNGVAVAAVPVGTAIRATGEAGQVIVTARVTVTARADGISDTVLQIDVAEVRAADVLRP